MQPYDIRSKIQQLDLTVLKSPNDILCLQRIINKTDNDQKKTKKNKHNAELQQTDPDTTKVIGEFSTWAVFSHLMLEMDFNYFHRFSWGKTHLNDMSHAMVINNHQYPFIGQIKIVQKM